MKGRRPGSGRPRSVFRQAYRTLLGVVLLVYAGALLLQLRLLGGQGRRQEEVCHAKLEALGLWQNNDNSGQLRHTVTQGTLARRRLYADMASQLPTQGLQLGQVQTQGLDQSQLFLFKGSKITPVLHPLAIPVRAIVAPFVDLLASRALSAAVKQHLLPLMQPAGIWLQNSLMYHATIFHASHHQNPVKASREAVVAEAMAVERVGHRSCPMRVALERVVTTSSGNLVACWQVVSGTEPGTLREALASVLPNAPRREVQAVREPAILHTTLARLLKPPRRRHGRRQAGAVSDEAELLQQAMDRITADLCGLETTLNQIWYIEEEDLLALALNGRFRKHKVTLRCPWTAKT